MLEPDITVRLVSESAEFQAFHDQWNELVDQSTYPNFFRRFEWVTLWWKWFGESLGKLHVLLVSNDDRLVAAVPLWKSGKRLQFLGYGARPCPEYPGLIIKPDCQDVACSAIEEWLEANGNQWDEIVFDEFALDDTVTVRFVERLKARYPTWAKEGESRYFIPLPETYDEYLATRSSHNRQKKRTRLRKAINSYQAVAKKAEVSQVDSWFPLLPKFSTMSLTRRGSVSPWLQKDFAAFHRELMETLIPSGEVRLLFLECNEQPVAFRYGFTYGKKFYAYQTACDPSHPSRPGDTLTQLALMQLIEEGYTEFDFLRGLEDYKSNWTDFKRETEVVHVFRRKGFSYWKRVIWENVIRPLGRKIKWSFMQSKTSHPPDMS